MIPKLNDTVSTPNGPAIFQFNMWRDGQKLAVVSHKPNAQIDLNKCQGYAGDGKGIWYLCEYLTSEVTA